MKSLYLFRADSVSVESDLFTVLPGHIAIITAYSIPEIQHESEIEGDPDEDSRILVERTSSPQTDLEIDKLEQRLVGLSILPASVARHVQVVRSCDEWSLDFCNNIKAITVPGVYRLRLSTPEMIGTTVVEITTLSIAQASEIPESIKLGY